MWNDFLGSQAGARDGERTYASWHFCDNQHDADECARLVVSGRKQATTPSLWELQDSEEPMPCVGDLHIITSWAGIAQCVIRITRVDILPLHAIGEDHARAEGEGDGSLAWWRQAHWAYYERVLAVSGRTPQPDMPVVFLRFACVFVHE